MLLMRSQLTDKADFDEIILSRVLQQNSIHCGCHELESDVTWGTCFKRRKLYRCIFFAERNNVGK